MNRSLELLYTTIIVILLVISLVISLGCCFVFETIGINCMLDIMKNARNCKLNTVKANIVNSHYSE